MGLFSRSDKNTTTAPVIDKANASPNPEGFFGEYGGAFLPPPLVPVMEEIAAEYAELENDKSFWGDLHELELQLSSRQRCILRAERLRAKIHGAHT